MTAPRTPEQQLIALECLKLAVSLARTDACALKIAEIGRIYYASVVGDPYAPGATSESGGARG